MSQKAIKQLEMMQKLINRDIDQAKAAIIDKPRSGIRVNKSLSKRKRRGGHLRTGDNLVNMQT